MEKIEFKKQLFNSIKQDDLKSFTFLMQDNASLNLCYGRFPILSLLYLYSSFKILDKYEAQLLRMGDFCVVDEPIEIYKDFKRKAKKTLRFFAEGEIVYPILMLGVLNEKIILKSKYKFLYKNAEITSKLEKIYNLNHNLRINQNGENVEIEPKKLSKTNYLFLSLISFFSCLLIVISSVCLAFVSRTNGLGTKNNPIQISTASEFKRALKNGKRHYSLNDDIEISAGEVTKKFAGTIYGNNHIVKIVGNGNDAIVKNLTGTINGIKFYLAENKIEITQNGAIIAEKMQGNIENCEIIGNFNVQYAGEEDVYFGLFTSVNSGKISNCSVSISANLLNEKETNSYFGGVAGKNECGGEILNCVLDGGVCEADTVDIAGIVSENRGKVYSCTNKMQISQTSSKEWHPNIAGIALSNYGTIEKCNNWGDLSAESTLAIRSEDEDGDKYNYYVIVAGIACDNYNQISNCRNFGLISCNGNVSNIICGGIVAQNTTSSDEGLEGSVKTSLSKNNITAKSELGQVCVGGVVGVNASELTNCGYIGTIDADTNSTEDEQVFTYKVEVVVVVFVGGVVGINQSASVQSCYASVAFEQNNSQENDAGGSESGTLENVSSKKLYAGIIANVGIYAYTEQLYGGLYSYFTSSLEKVDNNYYVSNDSVSAFAFGVFAVTFAGQYYSGQMDEISSSILQQRFGTNQTAMICVDSFSQIPTEVVLDE